MLLTPTCRVETAKICNQSAGFRLWWVGELEFSQPVNGRLDRNIGLYLPNLTRAHPYFHICKFIFYSINELQIDNIIIFYFVTIFTSLRSYNAEKTKKMIKIKEQEEIVNVDDDESNLNK